MANSTCYAPDGNVSTDIPCSDDPVSACCPKDWACLPNKLCQYTGKDIPHAKKGDVARGTCTDKNFTSLACPLFCIVPGTNHGYGIHNCYNGTGCCYFHSTCTCTPGAYGALDFGTPDLLDSKSVIPLLPSASVLSQTQTVAVFPWLDNPTAMATSSSSASPGSPASSQSSSSPSSSSTSKAVLGVGIAFTIVGILALGATAFLLWRRRQASRSGAGNEKAPPSDPSVSPYASTPAANTVQSPPFTRELQSQSFTQELQSPPYSQELQSPPYSQELQSPPVRRELSA